ncbi:hypothetical protein ACJ41O_001036 [Fusarium nematophilum]
MSSLRRDSGQAGVDENGESERPSGPINPTGGLVHYTAELIQKLLPDAIRHDGDHPWPFDMEHFDERIPVT